jgi:hypothetical protein
VPLGPALDLMRDKRDIRYNPPFQEVSHISSGKNVKMEF